MYGLTDFIGEFGGYLGLFLGGSILSIFEMLDNRVVPIFKKLFNHAHLLIHAVGVTS